MKNHWVTALSWLGLYLLARAWNVVLARRFGTAMSYQARHWLKHSPFAWGVLFWLLFHWLVDIPRRPNA